MVGMSAGLSKCGFKTPCIWRLCLAPVKSSRSAGLVGAVGNRVRVGRPGCTGSIHSDFALSLCTVFAKLLLLNVCHKNNFGLTFYRLRLSRLPLVGLNWMQGVAPWRRKEIQGGLHLGIFAHLPTLSPTSSSLSLSWQEQNPSHHHHADPARLHGGLLHGHVGQEEPIHLPVQPDGQDVDASKAPQRWQQLEHALEKPFQLHGWEGILQEREL